MALRLLALLLASAALGCSADEDPPTPSAHGRSFRSDAPPQGPLVHLRASELTDAQLVLELRARGVDDVYGVAWRLSYDPAVLRFAELDPAPSFGSPGARIYAAAEPRPGLMVGVVSAQGSVPGADGSNAAIATIGFDVRARGDARIDFVVERSAVVRSDGSHDASVRFVGGELGAAQ